MCRQQIQHIHMRFLLYIFLIHLFTCVCCNPDIHIGYQIILSVPVTYIRGFIGRAFLMETNQSVPNFRVALSVEEMKGSYSCSLDVFLGDIKVWTSGYFSQFYTTDKCVLELTKDGDLELKGPKEQVGWRSGTSGQGVERLNLLRTGNLVLVDQLNLVKWQTFNFPTNIMLWGQRLNVQTRLTAFPANSSSFFSFEIQSDKVALYLNSGKWKYSYWKIKPANNQNFSFVGLTSKGLEIFGDEFKRIAQLKSERTEPLRFLALENRTGDLRLYYFSPEKGKFESSFQAIDKKCDLPLACKPSGICTFSDECSCIRLITSGDNFASDCSTGISNGFCGRNDVEMFELQGVSNVLESSNVSVHVSEQVCTNLCIDDCECEAALYVINSKECHLYGEIRGVKQTEKRHETKYMIKILKKNGKGHGETSGLKKWVLIVVGFADGLVIFVALGGLIYYFLWKRRNSPETVNNNS
ncbi:hypothetical protein ACET3Z_027663 [Daucus carota]